MSDVKWTQEQQAAIETHGCNLLVAAAAGSGKTAVLVERIIKMITNFKNPIDIDKLLVVTFTNAAASEMKERIAKAISKELKLHPKSRQLQRQLTLLNKASITTIHSFCLEVIRNNFHCLDIDPNFRIADQTEIILLKQETLEQMFEEEYEDDNCSIEFLKLIESYSNNKDDFVIQNLVLKLYNFAMSSPYPKELINQMAEDFNVDVDYDFGESKWAKILMEDINIELQGLYKIMINALNIIKNTEGLEPYEETFTEEVHMIQDLILASKNSWDSLYDEFLNVNFKRLKSCKKCEYKQVQNKVKDIRDKVKKQIKDDMQKKVVMYGSKETTLDIIELYPIMKALSSLVIKFIEKYAVAKQERGIIDFNDFEHFCLQILTEKNEEGKIVPSKEALKLREKHDEILVDEYQDSNDVQEAIINSIARKDEVTGRSNNVFMVGDVKQSIYRFRQAKPEIFLKKYNSYTLEEGDAERKITLFKNFRSRKEILYAVNFIFEQIMSVNMGELDYDEKEALNLGAEYPKCSDENALVGGKTELHIIEKSSNNEYEENVLNKALEVDGDTQEEIPTNIQIEARLIAKNINELVNPKEGPVFKIFDKDTKEYRKVEYKDIVILLRSTSSWAPIFLEELKENLIPAYADTGNGYFETLEVKTILALLQIIDNPIQDIPLIAVLRAPIASFTPEELIDIRLVDKKLNFFEVLKIAGESEEFEYKLRNKCRQFLNRLDIWRDKAIHMPIDEFIWYLYTDTGYYGYVGAMAGGVQRQANLRVLFQRARQYEQTSYKGLFNFINFINKLKVSSGDMGSAKILGENENVVRIMSIHKSKGLEFPVVILSGLGKNFNMQDLNESILFHQQLGLGPKYVNLEKRISYETVLKQALKKKIKMESLSEEMRILYVALTRAKEKLIMTGSVKDIQKSIKKWSYGLDDDDKKLPEYEMLKARNYLDWIVPSIIRHKDGIVLRQEASIEEYEVSNLLKDSSKWSIKLYNKNDIIDKNIQKKEDMDKEDITIDTIIQHSKYHDEIKRRLEWEYPYIKASKLPTLLTVTELKRIRNNELYNDGSQNLYAPKLVKRPTFLEKDRKSTAAEKGTAMHAVMQRIDYNKELNEAEIEIQIKELVNKELITKEQAENISIDKILKFFYSSIGKRIMNAENVYREVPFHIELRSTEVYKELPEEKYNKEYIMLQGIIDCYFEEDGEIVLLDYKTDYVKDGNIEIIKDKYRVQLEYYAKAIEKITNKKVKEKYLYLFYNNKEVLVN
ncbi:helicase-exonuclease AddAB subunit AddA [Clostridium aestuarii]|uniref:ATP-dependent helicase/nuclease subunit A n=1 Tax=Clostridium aestuarii TaxID=338193 RepID=A0ABT4CZK6_9CLOT|nr:helicase-exonuclease AddAB subunit AddA [Clostridium aestuarii]MCY6483370.1 helicase-exonuclease AddAB subunit AddA [Clostridium aestuarii]